MARVSKTSPFRTRKEPEPRSNTEAEQEKEEGEIDEDQSTLNSEERMAAEGTSKGKQPMVVNERKPKMRSIDEIYGRGKRGRGVEIGEGAKTSVIGKPPRGTAKRGRRRRRRRATHAQYGARSLPSKTNDLKGKEEEGDGWDAGNQEEGCKRIKKDPKSDDDDGNDGYDPGPGGAQAYAWNLGFA